MGDEGESDEVFYMHLVSNAERVLKGRNMLLARARRLREQSAGVWVRTLQGQSHYCICFPADGGDDRDPGEVEDTPGVHPGGVVERTAEAGEGEGREKKERRNRNRVEPVNN